MDMRYLIALMSLISTAMIYAICSLYIINNGIGAWRGAYSILVIQVFKIWGCSLLCLCLEDLLLRFGDLVVWSFLRRVHTVKQARRLV